MRDAPQQADRTNDLVVVVVQDADQRYDVGARAAAHRVRKLPPWHWIRADSPRLAIFSVASATTPGRSNNCSRRLGHDAQRPPRGTCRRRRRRRAGSDAARSHRRRARPATRAAAMPTSAACSCARARSAAPCGSCCGRVRPMLRELRIARTLAQQRDRVGEVGIQQLVVFDHRRDARIAAQCGPELTEAITPCPAPLEQIERDGRIEQPRGGIDVEPEAAREIGRPSAALRPAARRRRGARRRAVSASTRTRRTGRTARWRGAPRCGARAAVRAAQCWKRGIGDEVIAPGAPAIAATRQALARGRHESLR